MKSITNNSNLSISQKMTNLSLIPSLNDVYVAMTNINNFIASNPIFEDSLKSNTSSLKQQYTDRLIYDLTNLDVTNAPNIDPCKAYKASIRSCATNFGICAVGAALTGPYFGIMLGLCGIGLMDCVDAADASFPSCVSNTGILVTIKNPWLANENSSCSN